MRSDYTRLVSGPCLLAAMLCLNATSAVAAQDSAAAKPAPSPAPAKAQGSAPTFEVYGFAMLDIGHDFKQINPNWSDTMRVTRLPSFPNEFGEDNNTFAGVRQSRLGSRRPLLAAPAHRGLERLRGSHHAEAGQALLAYVRATQDRPGVDAGGAGIGCRL